MGLQKPGFMCDGFLTIAVGPCVIDLLSAIYDKLMVICQMYDRFIINQKPVYDLLPVVGLCI